MTISFFRIISKLYKKFMEKKMENTQNNNQQPAGIMIHSQYIKDMSLEIPLAPEIFKEMNKNANVNVDMGMNSKTLEGGS